MKKVCIYHSADLDGICSAAIVKRAIKDVELVGWNYGNPIPWEKLENRDIVMADLCFQSFSEMIALNNRAKSLVWIDHHKSAILAAENYDIPGLRRTSVAACELVWEYFFENEPMPEAIKLLGMYDSWRFIKEPKEYQECVLNFQYGMRLYGLTPEDSLWVDLFEPPKHIIIGKTAGQVFVEEAIYKGKIIRDYEKAQNEKFIKSFGFEVEFAGYKAICANRGACNSQLFDSVWDPEKYDLMIAFVYKRGHYTVSLYSTKPDVDCSVLAKRFGGGGHKGAAGFQCDFDFISRLTSARYIE